MKKLIQLVLNLIIFQNLSIASRTYSPRAYRMPNLCKNESYCTHMGEYYPNDTVADALKTFLNSRWVDAIHPNNTMICDSIEDQSQLTECDSTYICDARVYYVTDVHNNTRVVIQSDLQGFQYKQIYLISKCTQEGRISRTRNFLEQHLKGLNVTCNTKYSDYPFLVLNDKHASAEVIRAYLPVFCQCTMKSNWV